MDKLSARNEVMRLAQEGFMKEWFEKNPEVKYTKEGVALVGVAVGSLVSLFCDAEILEEDE